MCFNSFRDASEEIIFSADQNSAVIRMLSGHVQDKYPFSHSAENIVIINQLLVCKDKLLKSALSLRKISLCHSISNYVLTVCKGVRKEFKIL